MQHVAQESANSFCLVEQKDSVDQVLADSELWAKPPDPLTFDCLHKTL